nr:immunoglobulin heavy chain junction region [Mus musculus]
CARSLGYSSLWLAYW